MICFYPLIADSVNLLHFEIQGTMMMMMIKLTSVCSRRLCKSLREILLFCAQLKRKRNQPTPNTAAARPSDFTGTQHTTARLEESRRIFIKTAPACLETLTYFLTIS